MNFVIFLILGALMLPGQEPQTRKQKIETRKTETNERRERRAAETRARREELAEKTRIRREASRVASAARSNQYGRSSSGYNRWAPQQIVASQEGSVAIAKNAGVTFDPIDCLERAVKVLGSADKGAGYCEKIFDREAKRSEKVSNEGADGTKNSRPLVILPRRGW